MKGIDTFLKFKKAIGDSSDLSDAEYRVRSERAWQAMAAQRKNKSFLSHLSEEERESLHRQLLDRNSELSKIMLAVRGAPIEPIVDEARRLQEGEFQFSNPPYEKE